VLDRTELNAAERVTALVRQLLAKRDLDRPVGADESLTACGLSSLDVVNLMLAVEGEFAVKIPDRAMTPSNFRSIASIAALVNALSLEHAPAGG
jgi:acyl carrier protein